MGRGILWVSSRIVKPEALSPEKLCEWYENEHIQEVLVLPGAPSAVRYEAMQPQPDAETYSKEAPWLVVYEMLDAEYRNSDDFTGIAKRNPPSKELIETVYNNTRFDIRFYEEVQVVEGQNVEKGAPKLIISAALEPPSDAASISDFDKWYREEHIPMLSRAPGFVRSRRYEIASAIKLDQLQPSDEKEAVPRFLALHEFSGEALPWKELNESVSTEWAKRIMGSLVKQEVGWYQFKRDYPESEWGHVGK